MKKSILILLFITYKIGIAQSFELRGNDTINLVDATGKKQGNWVVLNKSLHKKGYTDDQKVEEGKFIDSKKSGIWKEYYPSDNIKSIISYENNRPSGYAKMYYDNGKIKEEGIWKNSRWIGDYKLYYENGQIQLSFKFNQNGKREGEQTYFHENGQIMIVGNWAGGKEAGVLKEYYENGDIKSEKNFDNGVIDDNTIKNFEPQKPFVKSAEKTIPSPPVLVQKSDTDNLGKTFTGDGYWKLYNSNKQVSKDGFFLKNRLMDGKVYNYSPDGILTRIAIYKEGKYIGDSIIEE